MKNKLCEKPESAMKQITSMNFLSPGFTETRESGRFWQTAVNASTEKSSTSLHLRFSALLSTSYMVRHLIFRTFCH